MVFSVVHSCPTVIAACVLALHALVHVWVCYCWNAIIYGITVTNYTAECTMNCRLNAGRGLQQLRSEEQRQLRYRRVVRLAGQSSCSASKPERLTLMKCFVQHTQSRPSLTSAWNCLCQCGDTAVISGDDNALQHNEVTTKSDYTYRNAQVSC